jgi:hypothetical protein
MTPPTAAAPDPVATPTPTPAPVARPSRATWHRPVGIGLLAGGGVGLGLGVVGALLREGAANRFNQAGCLLNPTQDTLTVNSAACRDHLASTQTAQTLNLVGFIAAGVLAAAGVTVYLLAPRSSDNVRVSVDVDDRGARGELTVRF